MTGILLEVKILCEDCKQVLYEHTVAWHPAFGYGFDTRNHLCPEKVI